MGLWPWKKVLGLCMFWGRENASSIWEIEDGVVISCAKLQEYILCWLSSFIWKQTLAVETFLIFLGFSTCTDLSV